MGDLIELKEQMKITVLLLISAPTYSPLLILNQNVILCSYTVFRHKLCRYIYKKKENRVKYIYHITLFVRWKQDGNTPGTDDRGVIVCCHAAQRLGPGDADQEERSRRADRAARRHAARHEKNHR